MYSEDSLRGIVVSTANHFTYWAQELSRKVQNKGCLIDLVDRGKLDLMLDPLIPVRPWNAIYDEYIHGWGDDVPDGRAVFDLLEKRLGCPRTEAKKSQLDLF
ncbi:MAG TPA: hypothetical protein VJR02_28815 [Pyrinomonadaceae bacterium]|nr:hypothetical protein [Pyrinomonadaceae bacterium]